jgi:two-component system nitrate/nitrite response regulator NarL
MMGTRQSIRVVLADDHQVVRHGIQQFLASANIDVVAEAENGAQALQLIERDRSGTAGARAWLAGGTADSDRF